MKTTDLFRGSRFLLEYLQSNLRNKLGLLGPLHRLSISVTSRCNSRCITCDLWKNSSSNPDDLSLEDFKSIASSKLVKKAHSIILTGGEPFLRKDIQQIIKIFSENTTAGIWIITNGLLSQKIIIAAEQIKKNGLHVKKITLSLNGKPEAHDKTRGIEGSYNKVVETLRGLRDLSFYTSIIFTITPENYDQIEWAYEQAKQFDANINFYPEVNSYRFDKQSDNRELTDKQKEIALKQLKTIFQKRKYYYFDDSTLYYIIKTFQNKQVCRCYSGLQSVFVNWDGQIYPCEGFDENLSMGNIKKMSFDESWRSLEASKIRKYIKDDKCQPCFLCCDIVPSLRKQVGRMTKYTLSRRLWKNNTL